MNDGTVDYKNYHSVDSLAFGSCEYPYRNLGHLTKLQFKQTTHAFEVMVDDKLCFSTDKVTRHASGHAPQSLMSRQIQLPKDYFFGITAASADVPDSFEINKFLVFTDPASPIRQEQHHQDQHQQQQHGQQQQQQQTTGDQGQGNRMQDTPATQYTSSQAQFEDLHNRIQYVSHTQEMTNLEISRLQDVSGNRHQDILRAVQGATDKLSELERKLDSIERSLSVFESKFGYLQTTMRDSHSNLVESLPRHMTDGATPSRAIPDPPDNCTDTNTVLTTNGPRMGLIIVVFVIVQVVMVGAYQLYKRRSKQGPKKYL